MHVLLLCLCVLSVTIIVYAPESIVEENEIKIGEVGSQLDGEYCCFRECNLADFLLDSYFNYAAEIIRKSTKPIGEKEQSTKKPPIIVMLNCEAIGRISFKEGPIYEKHLKAALPNPTEMGWVYMPGSDIRRAFEKAVMVNGNHFLQQYGLLLIIDRNKKSGEQIFHHIPVAPAYHPLNDADTYIVILSDYMWVNMRDDYGFNEKLNFIQLRKNLFEIALNAILTEKNIPIIKQPDSRIGFMPETSPTTERSELSTLNELSTLIEKIKK